MAGERVVSAARRMASIISMLYFYSNGQGGVSSLGFWGRVVVYCDAGDDAIFSVFCRLESGSLVLMLLRRLNGITEGAYILTLLFSDRLAIVVIALLAEWSSAGVAVEQSTQIGPSHRL